MVVSGWTMRGRQMGGEGVWVGRRADCRCKERLVQRREAGSMEEARAERECR